MTLDACIKEWRSKKRRVGCVGAANFVVKRVKGFKAKRVTRWTKQGVCWQHVVATDGEIVIDLLPAADSPRPRSEW